MPSRVLRRRAATAFGIYGSAVVGVLGTIVAARELSVPDFARFAIVFATTSLLQLFVDLTIDEVVVKYGNRYAAREDWGRFRRLFEIGLAVKMAGGAAGSVVIVAAAFLAPYIWTLHGLRNPMLIAALIPLIQQPEGMAGAVLLLRNRYDLRGGLLFWSMLLRLAAIVIGAPHGLLWIFTAIVLAQVVSSITVCWVAYAAYRRYPRAERRPLAEDAREIRAFAIQSTIASGLTSLRTGLPTVLIGVVASARQVSFLRAAQAPSTAFASLSAPARLVLLAEQTRDIEFGRADRAYALLRRYIAGTALLGLVITPILWIAMPTLIRWVYKAKYVPAANAFRVMLLAAVVQLVFAWTKSFPVSIGRAGLRTVGQLCEIAVLVPAVLLLADRYGATGAAGGVLAGAVTLAVFWSVALLRLRSEP
jgi:O-antigen/teichoic acid export membrane protein